MKFSFKSKFKYCNGENLVKIVLYELDINTVTSMATNILIITDVTMNIVLTNNLLMKFFIIFGYSFKSLFLEISKIIRD